ncbi:DUF488 domain-containing protein [Microvirga sp. W0021]|uniref:DUF488 domain-containing protein n=1 Tax=Hohaiivirga grylli TaxID=3133970 RepID=A0ABV0BK15_9HYPH
MQIAVKRVYDMPDGNDGQRILVDRLWPRGMTKGKAQLTLWLKEIAPSNELRKWFHQDMSQRQEFERRYRQELAGNPEAVAHLQKIIAEGKVTLLYAAHDTTYNHALFLQKYMQELSA